MEREEEGAETCFKKSDDVVDCDDRLKEFHGVVAAAMEAEGIRGAAYAFRGPVRVRTETNCLYFPALID